MAYVEIKNVTKLYPIKTPPFRPPAYLQALRGVSLSIERGETVGIVGESGCGKSTLGRVLLNLIAPSSGEVWFDGQRISDLSGAHMRPLRKRMQIVFQDPYGALNPRMTIRALLEEPLVIHGLAGDGQGRERRMHELLDRVGLARDSLHRYPHEFSGGQRQRLVIARALAVEPELLVCDEPVSSLDVSIQAQIVNLLLALQRELKLTYLFISHDLRLVEHVSDRVLVMYLGKVVEEATAETIYAGARHPYTQALLSAIPQPDEPRERIVLQGEPPSAVSPPSGCPFHTRCFMAEERCRTEEPKLEEQGERHRAACYVAPRPRP